MTFINENVFTWKRYDPLNKPLHEFTCCAQWRTPPNSEGPPKSCQTQRDCEHCYRIAEFEDAYTARCSEKKGSKILKLPPFRNCFTLAMTNKLVVIINSLKVPKIRKILLYEMKFLEPKLQINWLSS